MTDLTTPSLLDALLDDIANRVLTKLRINGISDAPFAEAFAKELLSNSRFSESIDKRVSEEVVAYMENIVYTDAFSTAVQNIAKGETEKYLESNIDFSNNHRLTSYIESIADNQVELFIKNEFDIECEVREAIDNLTFEVTLS
jgi:hypothetical protein